MIDKYKDRSGRIYWIKEMKDDHLLNAHRYFSEKRLELERKGFPGKDILRISLLINSVWQEIEARELLKY